MPQCVIRAIYSERTIRVYQAYSPEIALPALRHGRFVSPFKMERMTWIKPSFNWMMYRCGFGSKPGQESVLGIDITREGFEWALRHATLSRFHPQFHSSYEDWQRSLESSPVRIQWDPERDWKLQPIDGVRAIQIGLSGEAVERYVNQWTIAIEDVTPIAHAAAAAAKSRSPVPEMPGAAERAYPIDAELAASICMH
jgi:hypothetical protein